MTHNMTTTVNAHTFAVAFSLLLVANVFLYVLNVAIKSIQERRKRQEEQTHAAVLQMATRRRLSRRVNVSPTKMRGRSRGRARGLEHDRSSSDEEVVLKPDGADTMPKMRTRSATRAYNSD